MPWEKNTMRTLLVTFLAVLLTGCGNKTNTTSTASSASAADQTRLREAIHAQAEDMQRKLMGGDLDGFISYMHPDLVATLGGVDKVRRKMAPGLPDMIKTIKKITLGEISEVVDDGGRFAAFVPVETGYRYPTGGLLQRTYRIACSADGGKTWTFMDGQGRKDQEAFFKTKFPVLTKKIPFPQCMSEKI
jgi:hypothetical protein